MGGYWRGQLRAGIVLAALILTYFVSWCGISFLRHYYFYSSYDLATQDQVVWNTAQGRPFSRSIEVTNDLGDHVRPYLAILSLFYLLVPSAYVLLTFQSLVLGLSAFPLYILARRKFDSPVMGLAAAFCFLAYPPLGFLNRFDFHAEVLGIPLLIAAYERIDIDDLRSASRAYGTQFVHEGEFRSDRRYGRDHGGFLLQALAFRLELGIGRLRLFFGSLARGNPCFSWRAVGFTCSLLLVG